MVPFEYILPRRLEEVPELLGSKAAVLAGGTDLLDRLKERLERPERVIDIKPLEALRGLEHRATGLDIGALHSIAALAADPQVRQEYAVLAQAAAQIATPQLRNMGTLGGNLCQRPRCWYFRSRAHSCLKKGGDTCFAFEGLNQYHAILGGGPCFIVHPSDAAPALMALEARVTLYGLEGERQVPLEEFFQSPQDNLGGENVRRPDEVLSRIHVPAPRPGTRSIYVKFRQKQSLDFAISSVAALLHLEAGRVHKARVVLGGVAPIPWRARRAEAALEGEPLNAHSMARAAQAAVAGADPLEHNAYKVKLTRNLVRRALEALAA